MQNRLENRITLFNEIMVSFYLYLMMGLTDFYGENSPRNEIGWALLFLVMFTVGVNLVKTMHLDFRHLIRWLSKKYRAVKKGVL